ncbi:hypothetical protein ACQCVP_22390 [Rossellomorea vietnamensis]
MEIQVTELWMAELCILSDAAPHSDFHSAAVVVNEAYFKRFYKYECLCGSPYIKKEASQSAAARTCFDKKQY